ncbi:MAG: hypothetical protein M1826_004832 [Phylliscum demangeonii]|nr:MAG: hypothetical protein M1826_004832 [Phylliscum demangeonii]
MAQRAVTPPAPSLDEEEVVDATDADADADVVRSDSSPSAADGASTHDSQPVVERRSEGWTAVAVAVAAAAPAGPPLKRRVGRPPKNAGKKQVEWELSGGGPDAGASGTTPVKRRRGRPSLGGGRAKSRGGPSHVTQPPVDKDGNVLQVVNDEVVLPEDGEGEGKVDKMGRLLGGRQYRCRTFTTLGNGERLYMLSTEPARCVGFRDSYLFFQKHVRLFKIIIDHDTKLDLIRRDIIPHSYKGRAIGVLTARSVFREFGARIVVAGRKVTDDYEAAAARAQGDVEGELADPADALPGAGEQYNQNQYVAWHGASSVYHSAGPSLPPPAGAKLVDGKKRKLVVTDENWMLAHARAASELNQLLTAARRLTNRDGVYDIYTNTMHYPQSTQPTHARREPEPVPVPGYDAAPAPAASDAVFEPLPAGFTDAFRVEDVYAVSPPLSGLGLPGLDDDRVTTPPGLDPVDPDRLRDVLPAECLRAFRAATAQARAWKRQWNGGDGALVA